MSWLQWLIDKLTWLYLRLTHGKVIEKEDYSAEGVSKKIYWYRDEGSSRAGHCTPFNTITMNKGSLDKYSDRYINYVFLHEAGHSSWHPVLNLVITPLLLLSIITVFLSLFHPVFWSIFVFSATSSISFTLLNLIISILVVVVPAVLFFTIMSFIEEGHAELFALRRIGTEDYIACQEERREKSEVGRIRKVISKFQYPPAWLLAEYYNWRNS